MTFLGSASATATFGDYTDIAALHHETRDKLEAVRLLLVQIGGYEDGVEGFVDGLEALMTAQNALLTTQNSYLDQVEAKLDAQTALLTTQNGYLDGVESKLDAQTVALTDTNPSAVVSLSAVVTGTFTRPADTTAYTVGDLVANNVTAGSVVPVPLAVARVNAGTGSIRRVRLTTTNTAANGALFRVHLFKLAPTVTGGDNAALVASGRVSVYIGAFDITLDSVFSDGCKGIGLPRMGGEVTFDADTASQNVYALLEARSAYTPISAEVFSIAAETFRD